MKECEHTRCLTPPYPVQRPLIEGEISILGFSLCLLWAIAGCYFFNSACRLSQHTCPGEAADQGESLILDPPLLLIFRVTLGTSQTLSKLVIWTRWRLCSFNSSNAGGVCCWVCISKTRQQIYTSLPFAKAFCPPSTKPEMIGFLHQGPCWEPRIPKEQTVLIWGKSKSCATQRN